MEVCGWEPPFFLPLPLLWFVMAAWEKVLGIALWGSESQTSYGLVFLNDKMHVDFGTSPNRLKIMTV